MEMQYLLSGFHLSETPISEDQEMVKETDGSYRLKATLADTSQLRWWLLGFGAHVEILKPKSLREEFKDQSNQLFNIYR